MKFTGMMLVVVKITGYTFQPTTICITCGQVTSTCDNYTENARVSVVIKAVKCFQKMCIHSCRRGKTCHATD